MQTPIKRYVITGGPGIGKTTIIEILAARGHTIVPEAARMVIEEETAKESGLVPWIKLEAFQEIVSARQLELEEKYDMGITFHDRGLVDGHGYATLGKVKTPELIHEKGRGRYTQVFILDPLPTLVNDHVRRETAEEARAMHDSIVAAYREFGYEPIFVPVVPPEERADFILSRL
jgi:predicted ATPase